jgi:hypothetical protein
MRNVSFSIFPAIGPRDSLERQQGTLVDLLQAMPGLRSADIVPPLDIVNDMLSKGREDAGMSGGCEWEPFAITQSEWDEVVTSLTSDGAMRFEQPPDWVRSADDWYAWDMVVKFGFPSEFIALERETRELEAARKRAMDAGDQSLVEELHLQVIEAGTRLADLVMSHRRTTEP